MIVSIDSLDRVARPGAKGLGLLRASRLGVPIPDTWAVDGTYFDTVLSSLPRGQEDRGALYTAALAHISRDPIQVVGNLPLDGPIVVRASGEESLPSTPRFSGCLLSTVVPRAEVGSGIEAVWASAFSPEAQRQMGAMEETLPSVATLVQPWLSPHLSGVAHTDADIVSLAVTAGPLEPLVRGSTTGVTLRLYVDGPRCGVIEGPSCGVSLLRNLASADQLGALGDACSRLHADFDRRVEIEWLIGDAGFQLLQVQPLTGNPVRIMA